MAGCVSYIFWHGKGLAGQGIEKVCVHPTPLCQGGLPMIRQKTSYNIIIIIIIIIIISISISIIV